MNQAETAGSASPVTQNLMDIAVRIIAFALGLAAVLLNRQLGSFTGKWQKLLFGRPFGNWLNRLPYIIVGILAMLISAF